MKGNPCSNPIYQTNRYLKEKLEFGALKVELRNPNFVSLESGEEKE